MSKNTSTVEITKTALRSPDFDYLSAVREIAKRNAEQSREVGNLMWDAALVFGGAKQSGLIGKPSTDKPTLWSNQSDYATAAGYSGSGMGTLLARLDKAQTLGVRRDSRAWTFLTKHGQAARVGKVVKEAETLADLTTGLAPLQTEVEKTGKVASNPGETRGAGKKVAEEKKADKVDTTPAIPADIAHALHALRVPVHNFTDEQWAEARGYFEKFVADEDKRREVLSKAAAKKAATPAAMPQKKTA